MIVANNENRANILVDRLVMAMVGLNIYRFFAVGKNMRCKF